jgi:hypothetical protein
MTNGQQGVIGQRGKELGGEANIHAGRLPKQRNTTSAAARISLQASLGQMVRPTNGNTGSRQA